MTHDDPRRLPKALLRELAVAASCDPRTIQRAAAGLPIKGMAGDRARRVLRERGLLVDAPQAAQGA